MIRVARSRPSAGASSTSARSANTAPPVASIFAFIRSGSTVNPSTASASAAIAEPVA